MTAVVTKVTTANTNEQELIPTCRYVYFTLINNQNALEILEYFENNDLKAQLQDKDTTICKLKELIKSMRENNKEEKVNQYISELETINEELENRFESLNSRQGFVITSLKNNLRKLKGKEIVEDTAQIPPVTTIIPGMFKLDLDPLAPRLLKNWEAHIDYLKHTQEQADILWGIVEQAKAKQPLDNALDFACKHAKRIQELLVYVRDTCHNAIKLSEKKVVVTPMNKVKKVWFSEPITSSSNIKQVESSKISDSNTPVLSSTGLKCSTSTYRSQARGNKKNHRISQTPSSNMKNKVEAQPRGVSKKNRVKEPICDANVKHTMLNANSKLICVKCKLFTDIGYKWKPTGRLFTLVGNSCPLTRITPTKVVPIKESTPHSVDTQKPELKVYSRRPKHVKTVGSSKKAKIVESKNANNSGPNHSWGSNATDVPSSFFLVNDRLSRLFSGSRDTNLYTISLDDMLKTSLICLLSKASKTKSWLWHRRLSNLNFGTLNKLAKDDLARGIPKLKFQKDHMCSVCALGKSKKSSHQPKAEDTNQEKLYLLHMDLCGPMRAESINGKKYILVIVRLNATICNVRTYNGTEFVNQTLRDFYEYVSISHQTSVACTPQQNDVVERRNQTLIEAARTILIFSKAPLFLCAEAINIASYTQNRSLIRL
ncbi:retrovirus-related pol polyprotein from transposon TNT 1-94 [Tanacetum coccineum]